MVPVTKNDFYGGLHYLVKSTLQAVLRQYHRPSDQIPTLASGCWGVTQVAIRQ